MHRKPPTAVDPAKVLLYASNGETYPMGRVVRGASALYCDRVPVGVRDFSRAESWLLPKQGWMINRLTDQPGYVREVPFDWYIDLDQITVDGDRWTICDAQRGERRRGVFVLPH